MSGIRFYNGKTRKKEDFVPLDPGNVRMYLCGPTVYDRAHLGNARPVVVFDVLYRLLRHVYGPDYVTYVRNFTDVDDKIIARAAETGRPIGEITEETIGWYHDDMDALGALRPSIKGVISEKAEPRATEYVGQKQADGAYDGMIGMIAKLIEPDMKGKRHAYVEQGHVLFDVRSYPPYGALSGRSVDDMIAGARVEVAPYKRDPMDFVLWKPSGAGVPGWDSPWGRGRPGWHIECSAMSDALLGPSFDIHAGGIDLQFPHHENEIAQSMCVHPEGEFARVWLHNEMLQVEGRKMSKSLGNFFTVRDLLDKGVPGEVIRFVLLGTHYSKPMDWTEAKAREAEATLAKWRELVAGIPAGQDPHPAILEALSDDLNTAGAIAVLHECENSGNLAALKASAMLLGLLEDGMGEWAVARSAYDSLKSVLVARADARANKDFKTADNIRNALSEHGISIEDMPDGRFKPKLDAIKVFEHFNALPLQEKREFLGDGSYMEGSDVSVFLVTNAYQKMISKKILEALK
ncbi:MAG: cysteine--tRNA ligase [Pseudorhodobacter sp.]|nr:cysteine--tRNA ligase [Pseudorhodobacter sp.]